MFVVRHAFISWITLRRAGECCPGRSCSWLSCLPADGDESTELCYWIHPFPAAAERCVPRQDPCGRLWTPCSIIMASNFTNISHHSILSALKHLCFICSKPDKSIFLSTSFLQASHGSSTEFPIRSCCSQILSINPRRFVLPFPGITVSHRQQLCLNATVHIYFPLQSPLWFFFFYSLSWTFSLPASLVRGHFLTT